MNNQQNNSKLWLAGAFAVGAAIGYMVNSDEGRVARKRATKSAKKLQKQVVKEAKATFENGKATASDMIDSIADSIKSTQNQLSSVSASLAQVAQNQFEKGVKIAKSKVQNGVA